MTETSFVTCSRSGGAPASQGKKRERSGVHQLRQRGHARGEDPGGRGRGGTQNRDLHRDQPRRAVELGESSGKHCAVSLCKQPSLTGARARLSMWARGWVVPALIDGYCFIVYWTHLTALLFVNFLNNHSV